MPVHLEPRDLETVAFSLAATILATPPVNRLRYGQDLDHLIEGLTGNCLYRDQADALANRVLQILVLARQPIVFANRYEEEADEEAPRDPDQF